MEPGDCPWCGQWTRFEMVQGHYVCTQCKRNVANESEDIVWKDLTDKAGS